VKSPNVLAVYRDNSAEVLLHTITLYFYPSTMFSTRSTWFCRIHRRHRRCYLEAWCLIRRRDADDTQLRASSKPENVPAVKQKLGGCVTDVSHWCAARRLQLNCDKTEGIWIGSKTTIDKLKPEDRSLTDNNNTTINTKDVIRDLSVYFDTELLSRPPAFAISVICVKYVVASNKRSPRVLCWPWSRHVSTTATRCRRVYHSLH